MDTKQLINNISKNMKKVLYNEERKCQTPYLAKQVKVCSSPKFKLNTKHSIGIKPR